MMEIAMTNDERKEFRTMQSQVSSLYNVIIGDPLNKQPGFAERLNKMEAKQEELDEAQKEQNRIMRQGMKQVKLIVICIGIGIVIGGVIFGWMTWQQALDALKSVK